MKMTNGCCGGGCEAPTKVNEPVRELYSNENFTVGFKAETGKYYLFNKATSVLEDDQIANYVEALYQAEQFNYALINKTYIMKEMDFGAMLNFTGDSTVQ